MTRNDTSMTPGGRSGGRPRNRSNEKNPAYQGAGTPQYSDLDFIDALEQAGPACSTADVAAIVGCSQWTTVRRLRDLEEAGLAWSRDVGGGLIWGLTDEGEAQDEDVGEE